MNISDLKLTAEERQTVYGHLLELNTSVNIESMSIPRIAQYCKMRAYRVRAIIQTFAEEGSVQIYRTLFDKRKPTFFYKVVGPLRYEHDESEAKHDESEAKHDESEVKSES